MAFAQKSSTDPTPSHPRRVEQVARVQRLGRGGLVFMLLVFSCAMVHAQTGTIGLNYTGVTLSEGHALKGFNYVPPDNAGAVGPSNVVQLINGAYSVYDKATGSRQQLISDQQFWANAGIDPGPGLSTFNARIIYDPTTSRWIAAELTNRPTDINGNSVLMARSDTADPLGGWKAVSFLGNVGGDGKFVDYTGLGIDANGVYVSTNNYINSAGGAVDTSVFSIPKADLLAASPTLANLSRFDSLDIGWTVQPIVNFGPSLGHEPLLSTLVSGTSPLMLRSTITGAGAAGATISDYTPVPVVTYSYPPGAAQPDGTRTIGTIDSRMSAHVHQVGNTIYAVHDTQVNGNSAITWLKINEQTNQVIQEGILSDPAFDYFQPSIGVNAKGDMVIGFTRSGFGPEGNLSAFAVVGKTVNGVTTFGSPFLLKASPVGNYHNTNGRWGDYTTTVVDPSNPNAFWTFQEFAVSSTQWGTQITEIIVPEPGSVVLASFALAGLLLAAWRRRRVRCYQRA